MRSTLYSSGAIVVEPRKAGYGPVAVDCARAALPTPSLVLDIDVFASNVATMSGQVRASGAAWRPHVKAHRSPYLAAIQVEAGAAGITCGSIGEAEAFVQSGFDDVLLANVLGSVDKWRRLAELQSRSTVIGCVDHVEQVDMAQREAARVSAKIPLYIEVDVGLHRCGVDTPEAAGRLATEIAARPNLDLVGLMGYEGHCMKVWPQESKIAACDSAVQRLTEARSHLSDLGIRVDVVSCGGTGTYTIVSENPGVTEVQAGGGCLMDVLYIDVFNVRDLEFAASVETTVVSRPSPRRVVVDAGLKSLAAHGPAMPRTIGPRSLQVSALSAEHATFEVGDGAHALPEIGDRLALVPGRVDSTIFLYERLYLSRGDRVMAWVPLVRSQV
jgi:D-serine deaminase-like pyridoxal phosphate-dependent protein